jgi:hypothetical protein
MYAIPSITKEQTYLTNSKCWMNEDNFTCFSGQDFLQKTYLQPLWRGVIYLSSNEYSLSLNSIIEAGDPLVSGVNPFY